MASCFWEWENKVDVVNKIKNTITLSYLYSYQSWLDFSNPIIYIYHRFPLGLTRMFLNVRPPFCASQIEDKILA